MELGEWANIATIVAALVAACAIIYTSYQVRQNTLISRGQFWLELEKMFTRHDEVHINLRPGGKWTNPDSGPESVEDWAKVEDYMGLFEHCEEMLSKKLIDWETFGSIFSYRLHNILFNRIILQAKLIEERESWEGFLRLLNNLEIPLPKING